MSGAAAIVLAGGRSSRMGTAKAALDWHGSTLLRRVTGLLSRAVTGPVIVVRASGQDLPPLATAVEIAEDARPGGGPLEGLAAGLAMLGDRAALTYLCATDVPLLHPAFVRHVVGALDRDHDAVLPEVGGFRQPLAAAYRVELRGVVDQLIASRRLRLTELLEHCRVRSLSESELRRDSALARLDPELASVTNLNVSADYERALALAPPEVLVERRGGSAPAGGANRRLVRAWTLGDAAAAAGVALAEGAVVAVNGHRAAPDPQLPLVAGDTVALSAEA